MIPIDKLFGESPFIWFKRHAEKVHQCISELEGLFEAVGRADFDELNRRAERVFKLETEADELRDGLHELLVRHVLLPMRREDLFTILEHQDSMADRVEDIASILTYKQLTLPPPLLEALKQFLALVIKNCELEWGIVSKLDLLIESAFSGRDALTVSKLITELSQREDRLRAEQVTLCRRLCGAEELLGPVDLFLWLQVVESLGQLSKAADRVGHGIRLTLKVKDD